MTEIIAISTLCYLAIGAWLLADMEAKDRLGFAWTDIFVVLAGPASIVLWLVRDLCIAVADVAARCWAVATRPWR